MRTLRSFLRTQESPLHGVVLACTNGREPPWGVGTQARVLKGTPARVPSRIPGGDSSFPNGGPFGEAQKKSTTYDSGGDPRGTRPNPLAQAEFADWAAPPRG